MARTTTLAEVAERLAAEADERLFATGGQAYVSVGGRPLLDLAFGVDAVDTPVTPDTLFAVYCAAKPVFAVALASLIGEGELSLDDRLGDLLDGAAPTPAAPQALAGVTVGALLDHTAGLHRLSSTAYVASPPATRERLALSVRPTTGLGAGGGRLQRGGVVAPPRPGGQALTGSSPAGLVRRRVTGPIGVADDLVVGGMSDDGYAAARARLGVNAQITGLRTTRCWPSAAVACAACPPPPSATRPAPAALGRFYESVLGALASPPRRPARRLARHRRPA